MKSLNHNTTNPTLFSDVLTAEQIKHLINEGFEIGNNDSYCTRERELQYCPRVYKKSIYTSFDLNIYVFESGIGVDVDYECGGNSSVHYWSFYLYSFEEAYDEMVEMIEAYQN